MDYNTFIDVAKQSTANNTIRSDNNYDPDKWLSRHNSNPKKDYIYISWTTGGITGGSCWGGEPDRPVSADPEPEFTDLDTIINTTCPNISYMQYKINILPLIVTYDYTINEYYGNYTTEARKVVFLDQLYEVFKKLNNW